MNQQHTPGESRLLPEDLFLRPASEGAEVVLKILERVRETARTDDMAQLLEESEDAVRAGIEPVAYLIIGQALAMIRNIEFPEFAPVIFPRGEIDLARLDRAIEEAFAVPEANLSLVAPVAAARAFVDRHHGRLDSATRWYAQAARAFRNSGNSLHEAINRQSLGAVLTQLGNDDQADTESIQAQRIYAELNDDYRLGVILLNRAQTALGLDDVARAEELVAEARRLADDDASGHLRLSADNVSAIIALHRGDAAAAEPLIRAVLDRARKLDDRSIVRIASQNLGAIYASREQWRRAEEWYGKALRLAREEQDVRATQSLMRDVGVAQAKSGRSEQATQTLRSSVRLALDIQDVRRLAECQADLAAVLLTTALEDSQRAQRLRQAVEGVDEATRTDALITGKESESVLEEAAQLLLSAAQSFIDLGDVEWLQRTLGNLAVLRRHRDQLSEASQQIESLAIRSEEPVILCELLTESARLAVEARDVDRAMDLFLRSAVVSQAFEEPVAQAWRLARSAAEMHAEGWVQAALDLFTQALEVLQNVPDAGPLQQDILNDMALAYANLQQWDDAKGLLLANVQTARRGENRVELAKSLANLGEVLRREGDFERSTAYLQEAAELQEDIGDYAEAASTWALLTNTWVVLERLGQASTSATRANAAAERSGSPEARGRALAAQAGALYGHGDYAASARLSTAAFELETGVHRLESRAHALEAWARAGRFDEYQRLLDPLVREALRRNDLLARAGDVLVRPARVWLVAGQPRRAARTLAYALALACLGAVQSYQRRPQAFDGEPMRNLAETIGAVAETLVTPDADAQDQARCRRDMLRQFNAILTEPSELAMEWLEQAETAMRRVYFRDADDAGDDSPEPSDRA